MKKQLIMMFMAVVVVAGLCPGLAFAGDSGMTSLAAAQQTAVASQGGKKAACLQVQAKHKKGAKGSYAKVYPNSSYRENPCYCVTIYKYKKGKLTFDVMRVGPNSRYVYLTDKITAKVKNGKAKFKYSNDGWFNKGKGTIKLGKGFLKVKVTQTTRSNLVFNRSTLSTPGWQKLKLMSNVALNKAICNYL